MSRFKNITLIAIIILLSIINYVWAENNRPENEEILQLAFNTTGADIVEININGNNIIIDRFLVAEEMYKIGEELANDLGITKKHENLSKTFKFLEENNNRRLIITGKDTLNRQITLLMSSYKYSDYGETTLSVDIVNNNGTKYLKDIRGSIENIFHKFNINAKITTCITGSFNAKLEENEKLSIVDKIIRSTGSKRIEGIAEPALISIAAYSPGIEEYIYTGNKKMNLNIAMRYNEYEEKTYIWIGTPIITISY